MCGSNGKSGESAAFKNGGGGRTKNAKFQENATHYGHAPSNRAKAGTSRAKDGLYHDGLLQNDETS